LQIVNLVKLFNKSSLLNVLKLSDCTKNLAFQLKEYESVNLTFASSISDDLITFIHSVATLYEQLSVWETQLSTQSDTSFSFNWTHNRSLFNTALQAFTQDIAALQNNSVFLQWAAETASQPINSVSTLKFNPSNPFAAGRCLCRSIATSLNLDLNTLRHSITSLPSHQSEFSSETTENISQNQSEDMTNNNCNESSQNNNDGTPAPAEMNPAVWEQILQVIVASVAWGQSQSHNASQCGSPDSSEPSEPHGSEGENNNNDDRNFSWKPADIDLFYPNMLKNWGDSDVVDKDNKNYYQNVYSFTNQIRVAAATQDAKQIHQNLDANLCEEAELWWNTQLSEITCLGLVAHPNSVKEWCKTLKKLFKISSSEAWNKFTTTRYTFEDIRSHQSSIEYVITLITAAKSCEQGESEFGLMIQTWMHIDMPLYCNIDELKNGTIIEEFVNILLIKQANWYDSYSCAQLNRMIQRNQQDQYNSDWNNCGQNVYNHQPSFISYYQSYQPARYGYSLYYSLKPSGQFNNQLQQQNSYQQQLQGVLLNTQLNFRPPLQITSENERLSPEPFIPNQRYTNQNRRPFNWSNHWEACDSYVERGRGDYDNQAYWSNENQSLEENPPIDDQADYQNFKNVYYNEEYHKADMSDIQNNQHDMVYESENTQKLKEEDTLKVDEVVDVEHVTETHILCWTCKQNFPSKNKLHLHLHVGCQKQLKIQKPESSKNTSTFIKFTAKRKDIKGYGFKGWRYATALTQLTSKEKDELICLNTECIMSLVNKEFLMKQALKTTIKWMPSPIQVKGIGAEIHQCEKYANLAIYLSGDKTRTAVIEQEVHIVKDLKAKMLVGLDILSPEKIFIMMNNTEAVIKSCNNIRVPLTVHSWSTNQVKKTILSEKTISISSRSYATVNVVKTSLSKD